MCEAPWQFGWSALEAIGTITTSALALFFWLYAERIRPRRRRPKLQLEAGSELWVHRTPVGDLFGKPPAGSWLHAFATVRIRLRNSIAGRGPARDIRVRALQFINEDGGSLMSCDPVTIWWSASRSADAHPILSPSDYEYLDLFRVSHERTRTLDIPGSRVSLPPGNYRMELAIYSSSAPPYTATLRVIFGDPGKSFGPPHVVSPCYCDVRLA